MYAPANANKLLRSVFLLNTKGFSQNVESNFAKRGGETTTCAHRR